jgi:hypothetical protein
LKATAPTATKPTASEVEPDRTDQNMVTSGAVVQPERSEGTNSHSDRLTGELGAMPGPAPSLGDQSQNPILTDPVRHWIYGSLLGIPIGIFISFLTVVSITSTHTSGDLEAGLMACGLLIVGSIGLITIRRKLINMDILKASAVSACFATVLSAGISLAIVFAQGVSYSSAPFFLWPVVLLAMQGLFPGRTAKAGGRNEPALASWLSQAEPDAVVAPKSNRDIY